MDKGYQPVYQAYARMQQDILLRCVCRMFKKGCFIPFDVYRQVFPLFAALGLGVGACVYSVSRNFLTNPDVR